MNTIYYTIGGLICRVQSDFTFNLPSHIALFMTCENKSIYDYSIYIKLFVNEQQEGNVIYANDSNMTVFKLDNGYRFDFISDEDCYIKSTVVDTENNDIHLFYNSIVDINSISTHYLESTQFMLSFILLLTLKFDGFLLHSGAVKNDKYGIVYYGESGAGKTTLSNIFLKKYNVLTDETAIIRKVNGKYFVFGSHWKGSGDNIYKNTSSEVKFTMSIYHSKVNILSPINNNETLQLMLKQAFPMFWDRYLIVGMISKINDFIKHVHNYSLGFIPNDEICSYLIDRGIL